MTDKAHAELLADVLSRYEDSPNPRLREITEAAIRHLHAFAEEVNLQRDEWFAGIQFLTATGQMCDDRRQEFILLSDTLGVSIARRDDHPRRAPRAAPRTRCSGRSTCPARPRRPAGRDDAGRSRRRRPGRDPRARSPTSTGSRSPAPPSTAGRTPPPASTPCSSPTCSRPRTSAASTRPTPTAPTRSAPCGRCRTPIPSDGPVGDLLKAQRAGMDAPGPHPHVGAGRRVQGPHHPRLRRAVRPPPRRRRVRRARQPHPPRSRPTTTGELATTFDIVLDPVRKPISA